MNKRVVITGLGVISSIGIGWKEFWDNLLKGKSGISPVTAFDTTNQFTHNGGEVKNFRPEAFIEQDKLRTLSRASHMGLAAAKLAMVDSKLSSGHLEFEKWHLHRNNIGTIQVVENIDDYRDV